jgi:hypothetical protein
MRLAEGQIDALVAQQIVFTVRKRRDTVKEQPRRSAPHHDVTVFKPISPRLVGAFQPAEQEDRG